MALNQLRRVAANGGAFIFSNQCRINVFVTGTERCIMRGVSGYTVLHFFLTSFSHRLPQMPQSGATAPLRQPKQALAA